MKQFCISNVLMCVVNLALEHAVCKYDTNSFYLLNKALSAIQPQTARHPPGYLRLLHIHQRRLAYRYLVIARSVATWQSCSKMGLLRSPPAGGSLAMTLTVKFPNTQHVI